MAAFSRRNGNHNPVGGTENSLVGTTDKWTRRNKFPPANSLTVLGSRESQCLDHVPQEMISVIDYL